MTRLTRLCRAVGVGLAVTTATLAMTQMANAAPAPPTGPASLAPPPGNEMFLVAHGKGVQIYKCQSGTNGTFSWAFVEPRATLTTDNGQVITHTQGPTWTAVDGSTVKATATLKDPTDFDPATAKDIQQLRLDVPLNGATGGGLLGATTFIQRLNTQGGTQPPTAECKAQTAGKVKEVPYQADYVFFKATA
jgi:hypothetical protein